MKRDERLDQFYAILTTDGGWLPLRVICKRAGVVKAGWGRAIVNQLIAEGLIEQATVTYTNGVVGFVYRAVRSIEG